MTATPWTGALADPGEPSTGLARVSVTEDEARLLAQLARGRSCCEIGTGLGVSTVAIYQHAQSLVTVDIDPWVHERVWPLLPEGVVRADALPNMLFDFVFIDGDHREPAVVSDVQWALDHTYKDGMIVCHDWVEIGKVVEKFGHWMWVDSSKYKMGVLCT